MALLYGAIRGQSRRGSRRLMAIHNYDDPTCPNCTRGLDLARRGQLPLPPAPEDTSGVDGPPLGGPVEA